MQIVIDIPKYVYEHAIANTEDMSDMSSAIKAIANGIPLPKGHGRLIDADEFGKRLINARSYYLGEKADGFDLRFAAGLKSAVERLVDAPTIIPADKEDGE